MRGATRVRSDLRWTSAFALLALIGLAVPLTACRGPSLTGQGGFAVWGNDSAPTDPPTQPPPVEPPPATSPPGEVVAVPADGAGTVLARAPGSMPVDLPTVMRLAAGGNLDVQLYRERVREAHAKACQAAQWWLPVIRPVVRYQRTDGLVQDTSGDIVDVNKESLFASAGVFFKWELGEGPYRALAAERRRDAALARSRAEQGERVAEAAQAYFDLLAAEAAEVIANESVLLYEGFQAESEAKVAAGGGFEGDVLRARARLAHARVLRARAREGVRRHAARLRELLGLPSHRAICCAEPVPLPIELVSASGSEEELVRQALAARPEIRAARLQASAAHQDRRASMDGVYLPDVTVGYEGGLFGDPGTRFGGSGRFGVGLSWDIGPGGIGDRSRGAAAASRFRQARLGERRWVQQIVREVSVTKAELEERAAALGTAQAGVADGERALDLYQQREQLGVGIPLDVLVATETLTQARLDYLGTVSGYNKAQIRMLYALGRLP